MPFSEWIHAAYALGASDLHLEAGTPVLARVRDDLVKIAEAVADTELLRAARELVQEAGWAQLQERGSADHSTTFAGVRCRVNVYRTVRGTAIAVRFLSASVNDLRACNLHPDLRSLIDAKTGLVIVSGPTGLGSRPRWLP